MSQSTETPFRLKTIDMLAPEEKAIIEKRITKIFYHVTEVTIYETSSGDKFYENDWNKAFDWEHRLWNKENLKIKYKQKTLPDWLYFIVQPGNIDPQKLTDISFRKAYVIDVPEYFPGITTEELVYLHPLLGDSGNYLKATIENIVPSKFLIVYQHIDCKHVDPREADNIIFRSAKEVANQLRDMLVFVENL